MRKVTRSMKKVLESPRIVWSILWRGYRIECARQRENDLCDKEYHYPDYPVELKRGRFEWQPRHPHLILNIKTQDRFTISNENYFHLFPVDADNWWGLVGREFGLGHYVCTGHLLIENS